MLGQKARDRVLQRYTLGDNLSSLEKLYTLKLQKKAAIAALLWPGDLAIHLGECPDFK
jgi:hypothetical protein